MLVCYTFVWKKKEKNMEENYICPYVMENGWNYMDYSVFSWFVFYLECQKEVKIVQIKFI